MTEKQRVFKVSDVKGKIGHGGAAIIRILIDDITCGAKNFSFLVNTMKAGLNCNLTGLRHSHPGEHCMFGLSGTRRHLDRRGQTRRGTEHGGVYSRRRHALYVGQQGGGLHVHHRLFASGSGKRIVILARGSEDLVRVNGAFVWIARKR